MNPAYITYKTYCFKLEHSSSLQLSLSSKGLSISDWTWTLVWVPHCGLFLVWMEKPSEVLGGTHVLDTRCVVRNHTDLRKSLAPARSWETWDVLPHRWNNLCAESLPEVQAATQTEFAVLPDKSRLRREGTFCLHPKQRSPLNPISSSRVWSHQKGGFV